MNPQSKMWLKVWVVLIVVFVLGAITGGALSGVWRAKQNAAESAAKDAYFENLKRELWLDEEQAVKVKAVLDETRADYNSICAEVRPRYDVVRDRTRNRLRALLTPEQQKKFDTLVLQEDCSSCPSKKK